MFPISETPFRLTLFSALKRYSSLKNNCGNTCESTGYKLNEIIKRLKNIGEYQNISQRWKEKCNDSFIGQTTSIHRYLKHN